jgi:hypothetical protein
MLGYLNWISFLGYDFQSYPYSQKISLNILTYPYISYHILSYPKKSSGANSQMSTFSQFVISQLFLNFGPCLEPLGQTFSLPANHYDIDI